MRLSRIGLPTLERSRQMRVAGNVCLMQCCRAEDAEALARAAAMPQHLALALEIAAHPYTSQHSVHAAIQVHSQGRSQGGEVPVECSSAQESMRVENASSIAVYL